MFPDLDPFFRDNSARLQAALRDIGKPGGMMDARDQLGDGGEAAAIALLADPALNVNNPNNPAHTAGTTFMGQFLDHDVTFDLTSRLAVVAEPTDSPNERTPAFDLDSVYGGGPLRDPDLYVRPRDRRERPTKLRIEHGGLFEDLPRNRDGAIIADPRNDENMMIAGLQAAFIMFHNKCVDLLEDDRRLSSEEVYERAHKLTTWHYQWIIVHEILPLFIGQAMVNDILRDGRRFYRPEKAFIPIEFQGAAYRFGHTLVRPSYRANLAGDNDNSAFFAMIFVPDGAEGNPTDPIDLRGGARARRRFIGWQTFFDFGPTFTDGPGNTNPAIRPNKLIDTTISTPLFHLPLGTIAGGAPGDIVALPQRNLLRHITWSVPSGQRIAREMRAPVLTGDNDQVLRQLREYRLNLDDSTPLWFYVLREGRVLGSGGQHLGPVGGRIVGEVFLGLLELDRDSYLNADRRWRPTLPQRNGRSGDFRMIDFLTFAGVAPDQRGQ
ncbi:MAG: peroxidase family protein [Candidatus Rokuibacteriota bacterium]